MLNMHYFKDQICDELCGAKAYVKKALEIKSHNASWGKQFLDMSSVEINHATTLYHICEEYYKEISASYEQVPDYLEQCMKDIINIYTEKISKIKYMQDMYNR